MVTSAVPRAALDIGSNTIRLLVARFVDENLSPIDDVSEFVRLGKGVDAGGRLQEDRILAAIDAVRNLSARATALGAEGMTAIATSAVRDASNREEFVRRVQDGTGVQIRILSGDEEARLTYLGATLGHPVEGGAIICDLGGGSAELIFATAAGIQWATSLQLGSGRLTEQFVHHDPPHDSELAGVAKHVRALLHDLPPADANTSILTGGTATHISMLLGKTGNRVQLRRDELEQIAHLMRTAGTDELVTAYGVRRERAQVLPAGVIAATAIVEYFDTERIAVTRGGIREGAILQQVQRSV